MLPPRTLEEVYRYLDIYLISMLYLHRWSRHRPLLLDRRTQVARGLKQEFEENAAELSRNHLINLESHSMPVFLFKHIVHDVKRELSFKPKIQRLASNYLHSISDNNKTTVFVGIHARRGDRLLNWKHGEEDDIVTLQILPLLKYVNLIL